MSKFLALLIVGIFLLPCVLATDIAYVLKDVSKPETNIISAINELGYDYELIDDSDVSSTDFSDYEMILVGNENIKNIPVNEHKSLIVNKYYYNDWSKSIGSSGGSLPAKAFNLESDITEGIEGEFQVYTSCCSGGTTSLPVFYLAGKKYDSQAITTKGASGSDSSYFVIATKENPSRVFFGITETDYWTAESEQLFENSLSWILGNKLPVCEEVPDLEFNEDEQVILDLDNYCSDFEGDLSYSVHSTSNDKNITLDGFGDGLINITSAQDWNGEDWVIFRVSDGKDSILTNKITLTVLPVNDAPVISSYLPNTDSLSLIENIEQIFSVDVGDVDGDELVISWFLNGAEVGSGENYSFSENDGDYDLEVLVSDGEFSNNQVWELFVGDISEYTCSEVGGFIIQDYEICNGEILGVKNSDSCCSIEGVFGFSEIGRCDILNESLEINILDLDSGDEFNVGETISFKVEVKNNLDERLKFDIEVYLYDIINEDILEKADESLRLDKGKKSSISFSLKVPQDADVDSDNAVFVKLVDENKKCNEEYV